MEPLKESDIEGLKKSVEIVVKHRHLMSHKEVERGLKKATEVLKSVGVRLSEEAMAIGKGAERQEAKTAKDLLEQLKKDVDELLPQVKKQKEMFENFQKEEFIDTKVDKEIERTLQKIENEKNNAKVPTAGINEIKINLKKILDEILSLMTLEKRMEGRQAIILNNFLKEADNTKKAIDKTVEVHKNIGKIIERTANKDNPLYLHGVEQLGVTINELEKVEEIVSKEDGIVRQIIWAMEERKKREEKIKRDGNQAKSTVDLFTTTTDIVNKIAQIEKMIETDIGEIKQADAAILSGILMLRDDIEKIIPIIKMLEDNIKNLKKEGLENKSKIWNIMKRLVSGEPSPPEGSVNILWKH